MHRTSSRTIGDGAGINIDLLDGVVGINSGRRARRQGADSERTCRIGHDPAQCVGHGHVLERGIAGIGDDEAIARNVVHLSSRITDPRSRFQRLDDGKTRLAEGGNIGA